MSRQYAYKVTHYFPAATEKPLCGVPVGNDSPAAEVTCETCRAAMLECSVCWLMFPSVPLTSMASWLEGGESRVAVKLGANQRVELRTRTVTTIRVVRRRLDALASAPTEDPGTIVMSNHALRPAQILVVSGRAAKAALDLVGLVAAVRGAA